MAEIQIALMVVVVSAAVLGVVFVAAYLLNRAARRSGQP
jgi:hypothetical protein